MAAASLIYGGSGGVFIADFVSGTIIIPSGTAAGILATIAPPSGKRIVLTMLITSSAANQDNISVALSGVKKITNLTLGNISDPISASEFIIGQSSTYSSIPQLAGQINQPLTIIKELAAATAQNIAYTYAYGD
jgi:hypothetical protein